MLSARLSLPHSFPSFSPFNSLFLRHCRPTTLHRRNYSLSTTTAAMSSPRQVVEHVVLFKVKPDTDPTKVNAMVTNLNALTSLNLTLYLTAGPLLRSKSSSLSFTHILHSRYKSKDDLSAYSLHPEHIGVVTNYVRPLVEDLMAVDWVSNELTGDIVPKSGSAIRVSFLKLKDSVVNEDKVRVLNTIGGINDVFSSIDQVSFGENFSMERAKEYSIASIGFFNGVNDLEKIDANGELVNAQKEKVRDLIDSVVVVDYVIPPSAQTAAAASL